METRPTNSSVSKGQGAFIASASASIHSRLSVSSSSSQRRLRALARSDSMDEIPTTTEKLKSPPAVLENAPATPEIPDLPLFNSATATKPSLRSSLWTKIYWSFALYCALCTLFFTSHLVMLSDLPNLNFDFQKIQQAGISPIDNFPNNYRVGRLLQMETSQVSFEPHVFRARKPVQKDDVTACLWIEDEELRDLEHWAATWTGPLSVVLVTDASPHASEPLIRRVKKLPNLKARASIHVLQRMVHEHRSGNSYLNLARLFSRTRTVVLFPASPLSPIPKVLYDKAKSSIRPESNNTKESLSYPLILAPTKSTPKSMMPFSPLSPLLVEQDYPVWCSERFFTAPSREEDWEECLWQFWLNSYGTLKALSEPSWKVARNRTRDPEGSLPVEQIIHRRLSNRFRHEACVHAARRLKDRDESEVDLKSTNWLKKVCRQVMNGRGEKMH